ncbi:M20 family metallopeptidase [Brevibacterium daeguense]|uniref:Peptidase M20 domain-containing protein 2 n=1 Tax=Brevibacterium daeguense TaxID=909936 RepID=A0ABP8EM62_9MICO|nr:M20 family metallopeptidase [Brevibacterium daeguense]
MSDPTRPTVPSSDYIEHARLEAARRGAAAQPPESAFSGAPDAIIDRVRAEVAEARLRLIGLSHAVHAVAEPAFEEHASAELVAAAVRSSGVEAEVGVAGLETAVRAEFGSPDAGRTVAILAEYDALPDIGHACGHNVIAASAVGAFCALVAALDGDARRLPGRVVLLGTPAEEGRGGKEIMARHGAFDTIDAALMLHPFGFDACEQLWLGRRALEVTFTGIAAHASALPFMGRNALDAASLMYQGIGLLRQQMLPVDRVHASLPEGGDRPSVIVERSQLNLYVRSPYPETLRELSGRIADIAHGAALMTGCGVQLDWDIHPPSMPVKANSELAARWSAYQRAVGRAPFPAGVVPDTLAASTDFGNVSWLVPGIHPTIAIAEPRVAWHTREFADAARSPQADEAVVDGAFGLAATALDFLFDDELADEVSREFDRNGGRIPAVRYFGEKGAL